MTSDERVLNIALHCKIEFDKDIPKQNIYPQQFFNSFEEDIIDKEISKLSDEGFIEEVQSQKNQFISPILFCSIFYLPSKLLIGFNSLV